MSILTKNLMILASAGSGKTYQLANRIIGLVGVQELAPERLVALTFTRKAAGEFADSVLTRLATGVLSDKEARKIAQDLQGEFDLTEVLEKVVAVLPRLQLTTLDAFFSRIVRSFQYELGVSGGNFDLLEGERKKNAEGQILTEVLAGRLAGQGDFYHAFRRASLGRGQQGVLRLLEEFLGAWQSLYVSGVGTELFSGQHFGELPEVGAWEGQKDSLIARVRRGEDSKTMVSLLDTLSEHRVGASMKLNTLGNRLVVCLDQPGPVTVKDGRKEMIIDAERWEVFRVLFELAARCELAAAVQRTAAIGELVALIDAEHERQLRSRGLLTFDDVKVLLSRGMRDEESRLRREAIDYRLDGRYDHWLLDEFQDTAPDQWFALESLIAEAVSDPEGGFFVVGDRKQAIYAWRGGEVGLFEHLLGQYREGIEVTSMDQSWRSCPAVLELVNAACGGLVEIESLFGPEIAQHWPWEDHQSAQPGLTGEAVVQEVEKTDMEEAVREQLEALQVREKSLSCGVLVRSGSQVRKYSDFLREAGFDVIEAGQREPGKDHSVGVCIENLISWLADPADSFAREILVMSPLAGHLGEVGLGMWAELAGRVQREGFAPVVEELLEPEWEQLSEYGQRRATDLLRSLMDFDKVGEGTPRAAKEWIRGLEVPQSPGAATIQVMTIHKSKGLGFDVVLLPELSDDQIPSEQYFEISQGQGWVLQNPAKWARELIPELREATKRWRHTQIYEALCLFYVALTRAKRGLYVFVPPEPKSRKDKSSWRSPANLIRLTAGTDFCCGDPQWIEEVAPLERPIVTAPQPLGEARLQAVPVSPSGLKSITGVGVRGGRRLGKDVHELFEKVAWLDVGEVPRLPRSQAGKAVEEVLREPRLHALFENEEDEAGLYREQGIEAMVDEQWITGVVDRLHVYSDRLEVIDFKTDQVEGGDELLERYREQMICYRKALASIYQMPEERIACRLLSTHLRELIDVA